MACLGPAGRMRLSPLGVSQCAALPRASAAFPRASTGSPRVSAASEGFRRSIRGGTGVASVGSLVDPRSIPRAPIFAALPQVYATFPRRLVHTYPQHLNPQVFAARLFGGWSGVVSEQDSGANEIANKALGPRATTQSLQAWTQPGHFDKAVSTNNPGVPAGLSSVAERSVIWLTVENFFDRTPHHEVRVCHERTAQVEVCRVST
jgi:hypothetical protein